MSAGMEMLLGQIMKNAGFDPQKIQEGVLKFKQNLETMLSDFDARLKVQENLLREINAKLPGAGENIGLVPINEVINGPGNSN